ncbi:MAG: transposase [Sulfurovaceae bacterium]|nr:transposase [Sulfurovaceae bacterium]
MSAFSMFHMQSSSFLEFQRKMQDETGKNNAKSLFDIDRIASDNHIRDMLDHIDPSYLAPLYKEQLGYLKNAKILDAYKYMNKYLIALDGTQYHSSKTICCKNCLRREYKEGEITYSHQAITPVIVFPNESRVISLMPELIKNGDGKEKQDCEINASKRWLKSSKALNLKAILLGDDLYAHEPFCRDALNSGYDFIFVAKEDSHKIMYEHINFIEGIGEIDKHETIEGKANEKEIWKYKFVNEVPINGNKDALKVNWVELEVFDKKGTRTYKNAFITDIEITKKNVREIALAGRTRWKIENENNNILKTKGYHLEHNFGHGKEHLSGFLFTMNILAFLFHTVLDFLDEDYAKARARLPREEFFREINVLTKHLYFDEWETLMLFMIRDRDSPKIHASDFI